MRAFTAGLKSPVTTISGLLAAIAAVAQALQYTIDGDASTVPNWNETIAVVSIAVGLFFARDAGKTSEDSGAKK